MYSRKKCFLSCFRLSTYYYQLWSRSACGSRLLVSDFSIGKLLLLLLVILKLSRNIGIARCYWCIKSAAFDTNVLFLFWLSLDFFHRETLVDGWSSTELHQHGTLESLFFFLKLQRPSDALIPPLQLLGHRWPNCGDLSNQRRVIDQFLWPNLRGVFYA